MPVQVLPVILNELGSSPPMVVVPRLTLTVAGFEILMVFDLPVAPAATGENVSLDGDFSVTAIPVPLRLTVGPVPL